jgi:23S rRNA pseudouridine1911/1915/1917 synthase
MHPVLSNSVDSYIEKTVPPDAHRRRLDQYLTDTDLGLTRSKIQSLIRTGAVRVNTLSVHKAGEPVRSGDVIRIYMPAPAPVSAIPQAIPLDIVYEDEALLVVNKPAGMVVHPACGHWNATLVNALLHHCQRLSGVSAAVRPGIVHRLDKDTSGLLVVAKQDDVHLALSAQLAARTMTRRYAAVVWGRLHPPSGTIDAPIGRHPVHRQRMAVVDPPRGRQAVTQYRVEEYVSVCSLVSLKLETGRTHQIRVHLAHRGHPVFGDPAYGGRVKALGGLPPSIRGRVRPILDALPRQALHAEFLVFRHPGTGQIIECHAPMPPDIQETVRALRAMAV